MFLMRIRLSLRFTLTVLTGYRTYRVSDEACPTVGRCACDGDVYYISHLILPLLFCLPARDWGWDCSYEVMQCSFIKAEFVRLSIPLLALST